MTHSPLSRKASTLTEAMEEFRAWLRSRDYTDADSVIDAFLESRAHLSAMQGAGGSVAMPQNADQAVLMFGLAHGWLKHNAPEKFTEAHREALSAGGWREKQIESLRRVFVAWQKGEVINACCFAACFGAVFPCPELKREPWEDEVAAKLLPLPPSGEEQKEDETLRQFIEDGKAEVAPLPGEGGEAHFLEDLAASGGIFPDTEYGEFHRIKNALIAIARLPVGAETKEAREIAMTALNWYRLEDTPSPQGDAGEETCPHGRPLHQDCFACDESSPSPTRRQGHSKLVYNKQTRTIDKVDPHPPAQGNAIEGTVLPDCMMPDGADPCKGYQQCHAALTAAQEEIKRLREALDKIDNKSAYQDPYRELDRLRQIARAALKT